MHKILLILGMLFDGKPMSGYDINFVLRQIGELYKDLKKANIYYLLDKLNSEGNLKMYIEQTEHGPQKEKFVYTITEEGKKYYKKLLRETFSNYETLHSGIDVAIALIPHLERKEVIDLLILRKENVLKKKEILLSQMKDAKQRGEFHVLSFDHIITLTDAELQWLEKTINHLNMKFT